MDVIVNCVEGITEHVSSKRILIGLIQKESDLVRMMDIGNAVLKESEYWPIDINFYDPFNKNNSA